MSNIITSIRRTVPVALLMSLMQIHAAAADHPGPKFPYRMPAIMLDSCLGWTTREAWHGTDGIEDGAANQGWTDAECRADCQAIGPGMDINPYGECICMDTITYCGAICPPGEHRESSNQASPCVPD